MTDTGASQAWAGWWLSASVGIRTVAFGAVFLKKRFACNGSLGLVRQWIDAGTVFIGNAAQPFAIKLGRGTHLRSRTKQ